jgi:hypothetical protein
MDIVSAQQLLDQIQKQIGIKEFKRLTDKMNRQRVPSDRDPRKGIPWNKIRHRASEQRWICGICKDREKPMARKPGLTVADHIDPHRKDFNADDNWQAAHASCNAKKGANTMIQESKRKQLSYEPIQEDEP